LTVVLITNQMLNNHIPSTFLISQLFIGTRYAFWY